MNESDFPKVLENCCNPLKDVTCIYLSSLFSRRPRDRTITNILKPLSIYHYYSKYAIFLKINYSKYSSTIYLKRKKKFKYLPVLT